MINMTSNVEWVADLVPDLATRVEQFDVATDELDDELIEVFIDEIQRLADDLTDGLARNHGETVRASAHSIKGMGGTMGLPEISVLGQEIELMAKENRLASAKPLVDALSNWVATLQ